MSQVKRFIMPLEAVTPGGRHVLCDLVLEIPIGSYDTSQDLFWTRLGRSLGTRKSTTHWLAELDSLRGGRQGELPL